MKKILLTGLICFLSLSSFANDNSSVSAICPQGMVLDKDGYCQSCNSLKSFKPNRLIDCSSLCKTQEGTYIRKTSDSDNCELINCPDGFKKDTWGHCEPINKETCPENAPLKDIHGNCYPCSELEHIKLKNENDCETKCQINGSSTRKKTFFGCALKECPENTSKDAFGDCKIEPISCPETHPLREKGSCYNCSYEGVLDMSPNDIHLCQSLCTDEHGNPTRKVYKNAGCGLINCPADKPIKSHGQCFSCDEPLSIQDAKNCDICQEKRTKIHIEDENGSVDYCALSNCPKEKPLRDIMGNCYSCNTEDDILVKAGNCATVCPNRIEETQEMDDDILSINKDSKNCILNTNEETNTQNSTFLESNIKQSNCPEDKPLMDYQGNCYACDNPSDVILELSDLCFKCPNRYFSKIINYDLNGVSITYSCKISDKNSPKIKRVGNVDFYYNKDNKLEKEEHHLTNHVYADTMIKEFNKKGYSETFEKLGKIIERKNYHSDGKLKSIKTFKNDSSETKYYYYYDNGTLKSIIPYQEKKISENSWKHIKEGIAVWHYETGELKTKAIYKNDQLNGEYSIYDKQGKIIETGVYKDNKLILQNKR